MLDSTMTLQRLTNNVDPQTYDFYSVIDIIIIISSSSIGIVIVVVVIIIIIIIITIISSINISMNRIDSCLFIGIRLPWQ